MPITLVSKKAFFERSNAGHQNGPLFSQVLLSLLSTKYLIFGDNLVRSDAIVGKNSQQVELTLKHERKKTTTDNHKLVKTVKLAFSVEYNGFEDFMEVFRHSLDKISIVSQASVKDEPLSTKISIVFEIPEEQAWSETELALYQSTIEVTSQTRRELVYKHGHMKSNRRRFKHLVTTLVFPDMEKNLPFVVFHCVHHFKLTSKDPTNQDENIYQDDNDDQTSYVIRERICMDLKTPKFGL